MSERQKPRKTPLYQRHIDAGARMVPFSGWVMPVQYSGIIEEHLHTRSKAGLFDVSHMGEFIIRGESAEKDLERLLTCNIKGMNDGKCHYGFLLNEGGGIIDDLIVYKVSSREYMLVVNAGTREKDAEWIRGHLSPGSDFIDISDNTAKLDVQGPASPEVVSRILKSPGVKDLARFTFTSVEWDGIDILVSSTGYTGEKGYELFLHPGPSGKLWDLFMEGNDVKPAGLGARDSLRLEKGYSLYGHDIDEGHTPMESGLDRFVYMDKDFIGKEKLLDQEGKGIKSILKGFVCEGRRSAREHFQVVSEGIIKGEVTSGAFSPCLKKGIGLCYIDKDLASEGRGITITDGKVTIQAEIKEPPFV